MFTIAAYEIVLLHCNRRWRPGQVPQCHTLTLEMLDVLHQCDCATMEEFWAGIDEMRRMHAHLYHRRVQFVV